MPKVLLSGNEAIARGAYESGIALAAAYPGTPSTEILENIKKYPDIYSEWSTNEKVALDVAVGGAYAGVRSMAVMKHVGVNVAADSLFYASMTGAEAGLVIVSADDPAMHSSQNEQDNRHYARFARLPCLEPSDSQEAKDMVSAAIQISEAFDTPVLLRTTTRIAHSHSLVDLAEREEAPAPPEYRVDFTKYVMVPGNARKRHPIIEERISRLAEFAETVDLNRIEEGDPSLGIITSGAAYQYTKEVFPNATILKLGMTYPLPAGLFTRFASMVHRLIVVEELDPFIEEAVQLMGIQVEGKKYFPLLGELDPGIVRRGAVKAGLVPEEELPVPVQVQDLPALPNRPPLLCPGCPHRGVFVVLNKLKLVVNGDIGCYTLGFLPPLASIHSCGCMGASIGVAHGANKTGLVKKNVAVLGDSTFFHSGMPALLNTAYNQGDTITIILDNRTTAMTGHQENPGTGKTLGGQSTFQVDFALLSKAMGIERTYVLDPYDLDAVERTVRECMQSEGPAVIIAQRECVLMPEVRPTWQAMEIDEERCNGCGLCFKVGCPALVRSELIDEKSGRHLAEINSLLCTGCQICAQVCHRGGISFPEISRYQMEAA
jgi:indolepyruvate ferredoxin oxidoreductase, alpha subunit